jgi:DNA-binding NarL/FixJ family response regulator
VIRVAFLDDHPAVRAGLEVMLASEPDLASVGFADNEEDMWALLERTRPEVVVVDLYHPGSNGLTLSRRITQEPDAPAVVLYSASRDPAVVVAAAVAGANAVVSKSSSGGELLKAIREVAQDHTLPPITRRMSAEAASKLDPKDHAILAMRLAGEPAAEIANTLWIPTAAISDRIARIVATLARPTLTPADSAAG